jgi:hypothetical protein
MKRVLGDMTHMKRVLGDIDIQGSEKRFRRTVSELDETKRRCRFQEEELVRLKALVAKQSTALTYSARHVKTLNANLLQERGVKNAMLQRVEELERFRDTYSAELFEKPYLVSW